MIYHADTLVTGKNLLIQEVTLNYKEDLERKKQEMKQRVHEIMFQAEELQKTYQTNLNGLLGSLERLRNDNRLLNEVLHDREAQLRVLTDPGQLKDLKGIVNSFESYLQDVEKAKEKQLKDMNTYLKLVSDHNLAPSNQSSPLRGRGRYKGLKMNTSPSIARSGIGQSIASPGKFSIASPAKSKES